MASITFLTIVNYLESLAELHTAINSHYRWNINEIAGASRSGLDLPLMAIDAVESKTSGDAAKTFRYNTTAFTILGKPNTKTGEMDAYQAQNETLDYCQKICFDIETRINRDAQEVKDANGDKNWLYGLIDKNSFHHFKVGPIFSDGLYGYRCELTLKNQVCTVPDTSVWSDL